MRRYGELSSSNQILARFLLVKSPTKVLNALKFRFAQLPQRWRDSTFPNRIRKRACGHNFRFVIPDLQNRSAIELMDVNDLKFALRIFADSKIEGRIAMGIVGTVRNGPIEWLIHDEQIGIA
jgi:hypothetical protein